METRILRRMSDEAGAGTTRNEVREEPPDQALDEARIDAPDEAVDTSVPEDAGVRELAAQFEEEKPGRRVRGAVDIGVTTVAALAALLVLWQVFRPLAQG